MKFYQKIVTFSFAVLILCLTSVAALADGPKYVFFFLGDGMANAQIQATEAYLTTFNGGSAENGEDLLKPENRLNMTKMPVQGMQTTYDAFALMTDSASASTAFASGAKTRSGVINMNSSRTVSFKSVAQLAHESGKKVGVLSSVSLDHATPASYYASVESRGYMNSIASQLANSGYEFFGGGGLVSPEGPLRNGDTDVNVWNLLAANGYTVLNDKESILALKNQPQDKVVCINPGLDRSMAMPYHIDKPHFPDNLTLAEMTEVAVLNLFNEDNGFFIMVEGGKIDWAGHANDAMALIGDMLDFDEAVGKALAFYELYPDETLIIVTGDHETGGMAIGHATTAYKAYYDRLLGQTVSSQYFTENHFKNYKEQFTELCISDDPNYQYAAIIEFLGLMQQTYGVVWEELSAYQMEQLAEAFVNSLCGYDRSTAKNAELYGGYEPIVVKLNHILNQRASIGWTSYAHTGVPVSVFAQGQQAESFFGFYDNTDIAKKLAAIMNLQVELPVTK